MRTDLKPGFFISDIGEDVDVDWLFNRLKETYWGGWLTRTQLDVAIGHSFCFSLFREVRPKPATQIGFAMVVSDMATFSSVQHVIIESGYRGQGFGTMLMKHVVEHPCVANTISIISTKDRHSFYRKSGFENTKCMKRNPSRFPYENTKST